jgi:hypothetical protein
MAVEARAPCGDFNNNNNNNNNDYVSNLVVLWLPVEVARQRVLL